MKNKTIKKCIYILLGLLTSTVFANDKSHLTFIEAGLGTSSKYSSEVLRTGLNLSNQYRLYLEKNENSTSLDSKVYAIGFQYLFQPENELRPYAGVSYMILNDKKRLGYSAGIKKNLTNSEKSSLNLYAQENFLPFKYINHFGKYSFEMGITFDFF